VSGAKLSVLIAVFFFTSVISVVTGSTSLITVPVMIALGIDVVFPQLSSSSITVRDMNSIILRQSHVQRIERACTVLGCCVFG
jgi:hypothetical protein